MAGTGTLIYSPGVNLVIESSLAGIIDVSEDITSGSVTLRQNGSHSLRVNLNNQYRKYDGVFAPNDRFTLQLKRFRWLQVMSGYLSDVPYFTTYPRAITLGGECPLKVLKNWPWDAGSEAAFQLLHDRSLEEMDNSQDGGISMIVQRLFTEVVRWPAEKVHIGRVPEEWVNKFQVIYDRLMTDEILAQPPLGTNPIVAGRSVPNTPIGNPLLGIPGAGGGTGVPGEIIFRDEDLDVVLANIRNKESGNDYRAINKGDGIGDWATGAYQFIDSSWGNYRGYARAYLAPPDVQDAKATELVYWIVNKAGRSMFNIPVGWYLPRALTHPELLDTIPAENEGNTKTIRDYANSWLADYTKLYGEMRGGATPPVSGGGGGYYSPGTGTSPDGAIYIIPNGVNSLTVSQMAWGGYSNGRIPTSALSYADGVGLGHPVAVEAYSKMLDVAKTVLVGPDIYLNIRGFCYRSYEQQAEGYRLWPGTFAEPGHSNHGWGLAVDINVLVPGPNNPKYNGYTRDQMYDTPEYKWLAANAWKWGWGHPIWARKGGSKPEPWHWEFFAFPNYRDGGTATGIGYNPFDGENGVTYGGPSGTALFEAFKFWSGDFSGELDPYSNQLWGYKALMNDQPILEKISALLGVTGRMYCSAPNGDFISWFPDYWGEYGLAGKMDIELIELKDFAITWSDRNLITHQYVEGGTNPNELGPLPSAVMSAIGYYTSLGVATIEMPGLLRAITNLKGTEYPWLADPERFLQRFGARVSREKNSSIMGQQQEFWMAVNRFTEAWASQFAATAPLTFMPELFPGMLMRIPEFGVQFYVQEVTHSWSMDNDAGFTTEATIKAPSAMDGSGFYVLPRAGLGRSPATGGGGGGIVRKS